MTRRMLKEEKELRNYLFGPMTPMDPNVLRSMINALVRAIREDDAKVAETFKDTDDPLVRNIAAAIRRKK